MASRFCPGSALARVFAISRSWGPIALGGTSRYGAAVGRKGNEIWHLANAVTWLTRPGGSTALIFVGIFAATVLTCSSLVAVDGDTIRCGTERMRDMGPGSPFKSGYDAPEIRNAKSKRTPSWRAGESPLAGAAGHARNSGGRQRRCRPLRSAPSCRPASRRHNCGRGSDA